MFTGDGDFDFEINPRGPEARLRACLDQEARLAVADALMERSATIARGRITLPIPIPADPASVRQTLDRVVHLARLLSRSGDAALTKIALEDQVCAALGALACVADDGRRAALVEQLLQRSDADGFDELGSIAAVAPLRIGQGALMVAAQRGAGGRAICGEALKNVDPDIRQTAIAALARDPAGIDVLRGAAENPQLSEFARRDVRAAVEAWHARRGIAGGEVSLNVVADAGRLAIDDGGLE